MIYFAAAMCNDSIIAIKIGYTAARNARVRVKQLRYASADHIVLLATANSEDRIEHDWHRLFAKYALGHEWFEPKPEIMAEIKRLQQVDDPNPPAKNALLERVIQATLRDCLGGEAGRKP